VDGFRSALRREPVIAALFVVMWNSGFIGAGIGTAAASAVTILMWRFIAVGRRSWCCNSPSKRHRLTPRKVEVQALLGLFSQSICLFSAT